MDSIRTLRAATSRKHRRANQNPKGKSERKRGAADSLSSIHVKLASMSRHHCLVSPSEDQTREMEARALSYIENKYFPWENQRARVHDVMHMARFLTVFCDLVSSTAIPLREFSIYLSEHNETPTLYDMHKSLFRALSAKAELKHVRLFPKSDYQLRAFLECFALTQLDEFTIDDVSFFRRCDRETQIALPKIAKLVFTVQYGRRITHQNSFLRVHECCLQTASTHQVMPCFYLYGPAPVQLQILSEAVASIHCPFGVGLYVSPWDFSVSTWSVLPLINHPMLRRLSLVSRRQDNVTHNQRLATRGAFRQSQIRELHLMGEAFDYDLVTSILPEISKLRSLHVAWYQPKIPELWRSVMKLSPNLTEIRFRFPAGYGEAQRGEIYCRPFQAFVNHNLSLQEAREFVRSENHSGVEIVDKLAELTEIRGIFDPNQTEFHAVPREYPTRALRRRHHHDSGISTSLSAILVIVKENLVHALVNGTIQVVAES